MPAFTLYGALGSTNTDRIRLTLAESGFTDYELVHVNLQKGEQKVGELFTHVEPHSFFPLQLYIPLLAKFDFRTS